MTRRVLIAAVVILALIIAYQVLIVTGHSGLADPGHQEQGRIEP